MEIVLRIDSFPDAKLVKEQVEKQIEIDGRIETVYVPAVYSHPKFRHSTVGLPVWYEETDCLVFVNGICVHPRCDVIQTEAYKEIAELLACL